MNMTTFEMYLELSGDDFNLDEVTKQLDICPCHMFKRGEKIRNTGRRYQHTRWMYKNKCESIDLSTQIEQIETLFSSKLSELYFLRKKYNLSSSIEPVVWIENDTVPALIFPPEFIKFAASVDAYIALDIYIIPPETEDKNSLVLSDEFFGRQRRSTSIEAIFEINGDASNFGDIASELKLNLTEYADQGNFNGDNCKHFLPTWQYRIKNVEISDLSTQIDKLKKIFIPRAGRLCRLKDKYDLKYFFDFKVVIKDDDIPGLFIDAQFVKLAAKIGAGIGINILIDSNRGKSPNVFNSQ